MKKTLSKFQIECLERRAMGNAAFGAYGANMRDRRARAALAQHDSVIEKSASYEDREKAEQEKEKFISQLPRALHIGPF